MNIGEAVASGGYGWGSGEGVLLDWSPMGVCGWARPLVGRCRGAVYWPGMHAVGERALQARPILEEYNRDLH